MEVGRIDDPIVRDRLTQIEGFVLSHRYSSYRIFSCAAAGEDAGAVPLMMKLLLTEIGHDMALLAQDLIGEHGFVEPAGAGGRGHRGPRGPEQWMGQFMGRRGTSIEGGSSTRNTTLLVQRDLGLAPH